MLLRGFDGQRLQMVLRHPQPPQPPRQSGRVQKLLHAGGQGLGRTGARPPVPSRSRGLQQLGVPSPWGGGVEADHVGEHEAHGDAVGDAVAPGQRVGAGVGGSEHGVLDGDPGPVGAEEHLASPGPGGRVGDPVLKGAEEEAGGLSRVQARGGVGVGGREALHGVGHGVDGGGRYGPGGRRERQLRVEDHGAEAGPGVAAGHLPVIGLARDQGEALGLAAGARRGRHADGGQHGSAGAAIALVVLHAAAVAEQEVDALGAVHGAAAAEADDGGHGAVAAGGLDPGLHLPGGGVLADPVEAHHLESGRGQGVGRPPGVPRGPHAGVGDQQHRTPREPRGLGSQLAEAAGTEEDPRSALVVEGPHGRQARRRARPRDRRR